MQARACRLISPLMTRHVLQLIILWLTLTASGAYALDTRALLDGTPTAETLDKKCIRTSIAGIIPAPFSDVSHYLAQPKLMTRLQKTYSNQKNSDPSIIERSPGAYYYVNQEGQRTELYELFCKATSTNTFDLILLASGKRFFGRFDVIIHIQVINTQTTSSAYTAEVYAYPRNMALRFLARRLGTVERYFERNTRFIARIAHRVGNEINATKALSAYRNEPAEPPVSPGHYLMRRK